MWKRTRESSQTPAAERSSDETSGPGIRSTHTPIAALWRAPSRLPARAAGWLSWDEEMSRREAARWRLCSVVFTGVMCPSCVAFCVRGAIVAPFCPGSRRALAQQCTFSALLLEQGYTT